MMQTKKVQKGSQKMKTEKTSGQLRELFRVAYVENQDQAVKTHELDRFKSMYHDADGEEGRGYCPADG